MNRAPVAAALMLAGCFSPALEDGALCTPEGDCPDGQTCADDGRCYASAPTFRFQRRLDIHPLSLGEIVRDFPIAVILEDDQGLAEHAADDGGDIHFTEADGETELDFEIERFDGGDGDLVAWVRVPVLSFEDTVLMHYGGDPVVSPDRDVVWDERYIAVWHGGDADPEELRDSTSGGSDGTTSGGQTPERVPGLVGPALSFDGVDDLMTIDPQVAILPTAIASEEMSGTVSLWVHVTETVGARDAPLAVGNVDEEGAGFGFLLGSDDWDVYLNGDGPLSDGSAATSLGDGGLYAGRWVMLTARIEVGADDDLSDLVLYRYPGVDAVQMSAEYFYCETGCAFDLTGSAIFLSPPTARFKGLIDEIRVHTDAVQSNEIALQFENLSARQSFYTVAPEEPVAR